MLKWRLKPEMREGVTLLIGKGAFLELSGTTSLIQLHNFLGFDLNFEICSFKCDFFASESNLSINLLVLLSSLDSSAFSGVMES